MLADISESERIQPKKIQEAVKHGFLRLKQHRRARALFVKEYVGQYYRNEFGLSGEQPINLIFNAIRIMVPNLVMNSPLTKIVTKIVEQKHYAELLGMALDSISEQTKLKATLRAWIVDAIFSIGIIKTGLSDSDSLLHFGDINIDNGQVYSELVDLDDFVADPICRKFDRDAAFLGSRIRVPRQQLLDDDECDHDLVMQLPSAFYSSENTDERTASISELKQGTLSMTEIQDLVNVVELWVPSAGAQILIPDPMVHTFDKYIKQVDYYGPQEGPFSFLALTPPVPGNPFPVPPVGIWYDLHRMSNEVFRKTVDQSERSTDILLYNPANADEAQDIVDAMGQKSFEALATSDPAAFNEMHFGGQTKDNVQMLVQLQLWFNYMSGNIDQLGGTKSDAGTATQASILEANSNVSTEDMRGIVYDATAEIKKKEAWYLHTDPFIEIPLTKRRPGGEEQQMSLTPEQRQGDFLTFTFKIKQKSMSRLDPILRSKRVIEFATNVVPGLVMAAVQTMQVGIPFNLQRAITDIAEELDILDFVMDWFDDPEFIQRMTMMAQLGPQNAGKAGSGNSPAGAAQNNGNPSAKSITTSPQQIMNESQQEAPGQLQSAFRSI